MTKTLPYLGFLTTGTVQTTPKEFENPAFFLRSRLPSTNPSRKRSVSKAVFKPEEFKNDIGFPFSCGQTFWKMEGVF